MWTMDELVERVRRALSAEYPGAPNGRVRDLPDRRAIRWYTTTGLVDRPLGIRGRTALYGPRHLLQLVALKRRQAQGRTLAEIQAELAGADDEELARVARVPAELLEVHGPQPDPADGPARTRFWAAVPAAAATAAAPATRATPEATPDHPQIRVPNRMDASPPSPVGAPIGGVALRGGAILVLPATPTVADRAAIAAAAGPLLDLLHDRGLLTTEPIDDGRTS
jgi:DNA-binding transcriptional MerR regulator